MAATPAPRETAGADLPALVIIPPLPAVLQVPRAANGNLDDVFVVPPDMGVGDRVAHDFRRHLRTPVPELVRSDKLPGGEVMAMTALEAAGLTAVACDPATVRVVPYAHVLGYVDVSPDGCVVEGRHRPEIVALRRDGGVTAYTLLPTWERERSSAAWRRTEAAVRKAYGRLGVDFRVLTEHALFRKYERPNLARMLRERAGAGCPDVDAVRMALARCSLPTTVAQLHRAARPRGPRRVERTLACVIELALAGVVRLDHARALGPETRVLRGALA